MDVKALLTNGYGMCGRFGHVENTIKTPSLSRYEESGLRVVNVVFLAGNKQYTLFLLKQRQRTKTLS